MRVDVAGSSVSGPVRRAERALAPDLARGAMLLLIAVANVAGFVHAGEMTVDPTPQGADRVINLLLFELVHARGYPVFAVMFGYGIVQLARRQEAAGATQRRVRSVLLRRNAWLVVFGFVHATLLYYGDFLGAYGIVGIVMTLLLLRRGARFHRIVLGIWALSVVEVLALGGVLASRLDNSGGAPLPGRPVASLAADGYVASLLDRLAEWPVHTLTVLPFIIITWLGMWAARQQILEQPARHRTLLTWTAIIGLGLALAGGLPAALISAGWLHVDAPTAALALTLHNASGMLAGPGYVAVFGLIAMRASRSGTVVGALSALGQRSLSGYLVQSVAWLVLLAPFTLALGHRFSSPTVAGLIISVAVWLLTVLLARVLDSRGMAGPAEAVLRRLVYGRRD